MFISLDPYSDFRQGVSPYNYVLNNPLNRIDPTGALDGWVEKDGKVFWDKNTNSQEEFDKNYEGMAGYEYVSDADDSKSYTLPDGSGKVVLKDWTEYDIENYTGGVSIKIEFNPSDEEAETGWFQTYFSNTPDVDSHTLWFTLPNKNDAERLDGLSLSGASKTDVRNANYFDNPPSNVLDDMPTRAKIQGAKHDVTFNAQSSMIINGTRTFSVGWGFKITGEESAVYHAPVIFISTSKFHNNAIQHLKY